MATNDSASNSSGNSKSTNSAMRNLIVYQEKGRFCGWPANNGIWIWGDEILVGFERAYYEEFEQSHSIRRDLPSEARFARSLDGGESWHLEEKALWTIAKPSAVIAPCDGALDSRMWGDGSTNP